MEADHTSLFATIFNDSPNIGWGSRGNPYFWNHLRNAALNLELPCNADSLEEWIRSEYLSVTGEKLTLDSSVLVKEYDQGGMSSGIVLGEWWINVGVPLLKQRLQVILNNYK